MGWIDYSWWQVTCQVQHGVQPGWWETERMLPLTLRSSPPRKVAVHFYLWENIESASNQAGMTRHCGSGMVSEMLNWQTRKETTSRMVKETYSNKPFTVKSGWRVGRIFLISSSDVAKMSLISWIYLYQCSMTSLCCSKNIHIDHQVWKHVQYGALPFILFSKVTTGMTFSVLSHMAVGETGRRFIFPWKAQEMEFCPFTSATFQMALQSYGPV